MSKEYEKVVKEAKQEEKPKAPKVVGNPAVVKADFPFRSIQEISGVKYKVTAVLKGGFVELTKV